MRWLSILAAVLPALAAYDDFGHPHRVGSLAQSVNLWRLRQSAAADRPLVVQDDSFNLMHGTFGEFEERWFEQPVDHFSNDSATFLQRYWINTRHYNATKGGPVFVLDGGETSGKNRLPFLDTGIVDSLPKATGGIGVVLEHRYYGKSQPVSDLSTDNLRWLNNEQSAEDSANFMRHVKFEGVDRDITAPRTPWIYYGGSYAGARAAHMRVLYPDIVYGAIASSAVTHAFIEYWEYMDTIRLAADPACSENIQVAVDTIDKVLASGNPTLIRLLKSLFGLADLESDADFASVISSPLGYWQAQNWDPEVNEGGPAFENFCNSLEGDAGLDSQEYEMLVASSPIKIPLTVLRYGNYIKKNVAEECDTTVEECFGTNDPVKFQETSLEQTWRLWIYQVCTQWGYFFVAPPADTPTLVSRLHTLAYETQICRAAFPPGAHNVVPALPNVTAVNALGDFGIAADRLALIDGAIDPWKPATPHSRYARDRNHTRLRPFLEIEGGVHHWDENGLKNPEDEPKEIQRVHREMIAFVKEWLADWKPEN